MATVRSGHPLIVAVIGAVVLLAPPVPAEETAGYHVEYQPSDLAPADPPDGYDGYGRTDSIHQGTRSEVCVDALPPGTAAFTEWARRWPGIQQAQTLSCRLIAPPPGRGSRDIPPGDETLYDTWSSHAPGRAVDLFVGTAAGNALIDQLLAPHGDAPHVAARRLGVLQIIFDGSCWEAREEQSRLSIHSAADMHAQYPCPAGASHRDHIHITLSLDGAAAATSGYALLGDDPPPELPEAFFALDAPPYYSRRPGSP